MNQHEDRDKQFLNITAIRQAADLSGCPCLSLDTKNKEMLGNYSRSNDNVYCTQAQATLDHDFKGKNTLMAIPHGIYDTKENTGYITLNTSSDTSAFVCENIKKWWYSIGIVLYASCPYLLILCDGGGSNSSRHYIFKENLEKLAKEIGKNIRIAHYPPYCSKWNPIEHRLFSQVSKAMTGANMMDLEEMATRIARTKTKTGLQVVVEINENVYIKGQKYHIDYKQNMAIQFDDFLPKWNYVATS